MNITVPRTTGLFSWFRQKVWFTVALFGALDGIREANGGPLNTGDTVQINITMRN